MRYYSSRNPEHFVSSSEAVRTGLAADGGLYLPEAIPKLNWEELRGNPDILSALLYPFFDDSLTQDEIKEVVTSAWNFPTPVTRLDEHLSVLELFHGPTCAFKDYGARTLAEILTRLRTQERPITVLVATSGDTGGAIAAGFYRVPGIEVVLLYPHQGVSPLQELQLTTWGENITALEVEGSFDDCQRLVKEAFLDSALREHIELTSANSINIARFIPQALYYALAMQQMGVGARDTAVTCVVPSGNLGNLASGLLAKRLGVPLEHLVCAMNQNSSIQPFLAGEAFLAKPSIKTLATAMDVGAPSNFERLAVFAEGEHALRQLVTGVTCSDESILETMRSSYQRWGYAIDPHTAVGIYAAKQLRKASPKQQYLVLATAHPAKFYETFDLAGLPLPEMPEQLSVLANRKKQAERIPASLTALKNVLV